MRTTLDIDDDVLEAVKALARRAGRTAGAVLSDLARRTLVGGPAAPTQVAEKQLGGFVPFDSRGGVVTNARIDRLRERDLD